MGADTAISWTDHTFNPWHGCTEVSPGCDNCYARTWAAGPYGQGVKWGAGEQRRFFGKTHWAQPINWNRKAQRDGVRLRVFCGSMCDWADPEVAPSHRGPLWQLIRETPWLDWLLLTKRTHLIKRLLPFDWGDGYANVWMGTTAENQQWYEKRWPHLARIPAVVRFVSYEPSVGWLSLKSAHFGGNSRRLEGLPLPDWIIAGGESGRVAPGTLPVVGQHLDSVARPSHPEWFRRLRDECATIPHANNGRPQVGVAFHFKQWGNWVHDPGGAREGEPAPFWYPGGGWDTRRAVWVPYDPHALNPAKGPGPVLMRWTKEKGGNLLDGREHLAFPVPRDPQDVLHAPLVGGGK